MITEFRTGHIHDISHAQVAAWQIGFAGILSEKILSALSIESFKSNWESILKNKNRTNYIWQNKHNEVIGFISYGPPKDSTLSNSIEIYGLYVHPDHWRQSIGSKLIGFAIDQIIQKNTNQKIVLWVMQENLSSLQFYNKNGFELNEMNRQSQRYQDQFVEVLMELNL